MLNLNPNTKQINKSTDNSDLKATTDFSNLTHIAAISKHIPGSKLPSILKKIEKDQNNYNKGLEADLTKTESAKTLLAIDAIQQRLEKLCNFIDAERKDIHNQRETYKKSIDAEKPVKGTTDYLILQGQAALIQNMPFSEVMTLARNGDIDTTRAVLNIPVLKHKFDMLNPTKREVVETILAQNVLGKDYDSFVQTEKQLDALDAFGSHIVNKIGEFGANHRAISSNIVQAFDPTLQTGWGE